MCDLIEEVVAICGLIEEVVAMCGLIEEVVVQWNLSIVDTIGIAQSVLIKEVSSFQRCLYRNVVVKTLESVLIREVPLYYKDTSVLVASNWDLISIGDLSKQVVVS